MRQDDRTRFDAALRAARLSAYPAGEFVGQESFMSAGEIRWLAMAAGVAPGVSVLDLCCGVAGPGRWITGELGCTYTGVDSSPSAIDIARARAGDLDCRFEVAQVPPVPAGPFDVVMLLETMLAFADKETLLREISSVLPAGGRFAFTLEEGRPLTAAERRRMPDADTVWLTPLEDMLTGLAEAGLRLHRHTELSNAHLTVAEALLHAFTAAAPAIAAQLGRRALDELLTAHRLWVDWLRTGRVRKFAVVAEKANG